jgi:hypothetical protein
MQSPGTPHSALSLFSDEAGLLDIFAPLNPSVLVDKTSLVGLGSSLGFLPHLNKMRISLRRSTSNDVAVAGMLSRPFARLGMLAP